MNSLDKRNESEFYSGEDYYRVMKMDVHAHVNTYKGVLSELALEEKFTLLSINADAYPEHTIEQQQAFAIKQQENFPGRFYYLTTFRAKGFEEPGWEDSVISYLKQSFSNGAVGIKVWKNIGMDEKTSDGRYILIDDPVFDNIFTFLEKNNIPLTGHIGEPKSCWLPLEEMITTGDKEYFGNNPEYHMHLHPEHHPYEAHIQARDNLLEKHPDLVYVGAHLGSLEWSVDELAKRLDTYPNMCVDTAERICYFQYQSMDDWQKVYDFIIKYQDRILYGTDIHSDDSLSPEDEKKHAHDLWRRDWLYFTSDGMMTSPSLAQEFKGLKLPKSVVDKIYYKNAKRIYLRNQ